ncbi:carboxypeptidase-like regulatory domain-containing protein [Runella slithyformis]|nr:carboxypeptidase-like regulatory domain-containing protein [Runella slithyformis]
MKIMFTTFLLTLRYLNGLAQTATLRGKVYSKENGGVSFAGVKLTKSNTTSIADHYGFFVLKNVPLGKDELTVSSVKIESQSIKIDVNNALIDVSILVKPKNVELDEVMVIQKSEKKEIESKGFAVNVIETKEIAQRNVQTNEMLDRTAGIRIRQNGGLGSVINYNLNGMSGTATGLTESTFDPLGRKSVVVDYVSPENPEIITSTISLGDNSGYRSPNGFVAEDGNIYQATQRHSSAHILRINQNNEYNDSYVFSLDAALGVKAVYVDSWKYAGNGIACVLYTHKGMEQGYIARVDLNAKGERRRSICGRNPRRKRWQYLHL